MLCLKPETSEMQQKRFHAIVKVKNFSTFPSFPKGSAVLKIDILGPGPIAPGNPQEQS